MAPFPWEDFDANTLRVMVRNLGAPSGVHKRDDMLKFLKDYETNGAEIALSAVQSTKRSASTSTSKATTAKPASVKAKALASISASAGPSRKRKAAPENDAGSEEAVASTSAKRTSAQKAATPSVSTRAQIAASGIVTGKRVRVPSERATASASAAAPKRTPKKSPAKRKPMSNPASPPNDHNKSRRTIFDGVLVKSVKRSKAEGEVVDADADADVDADGDGDVVPPTPDEPSENLEGHGGLEDGDVQMSEIGVVTPSEIGGASDKENVPQPGSEPAGSEELEDTVANANGPQNKDGDVDAAGDTDEEIVFAAPYGI